MPSRNERNYERLKDKVSDANTLRAYATTGLDSGSRREDALTKLDQICEKLSEWEFLGSKPGEMQAAVTSGWTQLQTPVGTLNRWSARLQQIATDLPKLPQDPGFKVPDDDQRADVLLKKMTSMVQDLGKALGEINEAKGQIGETWKTVTSVAAGLITTIETEVKRAVARVHNEGIETIEAVQKTSSAILGLLGAIDPTLMAEVALKGLKVAIEGAAELAKAAAETAKASGMTMEDALSEYGEWDIAIASCERWKGGVKVAIHACGIAIPKYDIVSPIVDGIIDAYFEGAVEKGKQLKRAAAGETPDSFFEGMKKALIEEFTPTKMSQVGEGFIKGLTGLQSAADASSLGLDILGKFSHAIILELEVKLLPIKPAQPIPALDIRARLGDLRGSYTEALSRPMDDQLKTELAEAMAGI